MTSPYEWRNRQWEFQILPFAAKSKRSSSWNLARTAEQIAEFSHLVLSNPIRPDSFFEVGGSKRIDVPWYLQTDHEYPYLACCQMAVA